MSAVQAESPSTREQELEALVSHMRDELAVTSEQLTVTSEQLTVTSEQLTVTSKQLTDVITERDNLRRAYRQLMEQFELLRRRIFVAKAERVDSTQLEIEFAKTKQKLDELAAKLGHEAAADAGTAATPPDGPDAVGSRPAGKPPVKPRPKPKGRRNLAEADDLPERRIEIRDPETEATGGTFIGWELSYKFGYQRPGAVRVVLARAKYRVAVAQTAPSPAPEAAGVIEQDGARFTIITAPVPPLLVRRGLLAPSMLARRGRHGARSRHDGALGRRGWRLSRRDRARVRGGRSQERILSVH